MKIDFVEVTSQDPVFDGVLALLIYALCYVLPALLISALVNLFVPCAPLQALGALIIIRLAYYLLGDDKC